MSRRAVALLVAVLIGGILGSRALSPLGSDSETTGPPAPNAESPSAPRPKAAPTSRTPRGAPTPVPNSGVRPRRRILASLVRRTAREAKGRVQVAILPEGREVPIAVASSGSARGRFRMWSVSKVVTAIALLEAHGWRERSGEPLTADTRRAMSSGLIGSSDCAQRQMVVELQELLGGPLEARAAYQDVLARAGTRAATVTGRIAPAGSGCRSYLRRSQLADPFRPALQLGTAEWSVSDGARFALALGDGTYARAVTRQVLRLLRRPKTRSDDPFAQGRDVTTNPAWGAGLVLRDLQPAYKSGWGGASGETPTFVNEQVIHLATPDRGSYGIAITFEPPNRPARDDPGLTQAPRAFDQLLRGVRRELRL